MEDIIEQNEQNKLNPEQSKNPKTILSILFNDYKKLEIASANEIINNNKIMNNINDLKIKNDDDFSKAVISKLNKIKRNTLSKLSATIDKYKICFEHYQKRIFNFIEKKGNDLSNEINNNLKNEAILEYVINNIFNQINNIFVIYDNIIDNIKQNFILLNNLLEKIDLFNVNKPIIHFLNNYYNNIIDCSLINQFNFKQIDNSLITHNNFYRNYFNFLEEEKNDEFIKTFKMKKKIKKMEINI